jgi:hypothetical protein
MDSPIIVSGTPRAGTTWVQWFLSQHPKIHIHGQEPKLPWGTMLTWHEEMVEAGKWGAKSNKSKDVAGYPIPHYAGSHEPRCDDIFKHMVRQFLCGFGPQKPRWGVKCLWLCTNRNITKKINKLWPHTKWIICIRNPFTSFESQKNTFVKDMDLDVWIKRWISSVRFLDENKGFLLQIDKLNKEDHPARKSHLDKLFEYIREEPVPQTDEFIAQWQTVHKVRENSEREFTVGEKRRKAMREKYAKLREYMRKLGY